MTALTRAEARAALAAGIREQLRRESPVLAKD